MHIYDNLHRPFSVVIGKLMQHEQDVAGSSFLIRAKAYEKSDNFSQTICSCFRIIRLHFLCFKKFSLKKYLNFLADMKQNKNLGAKLWGDKGFSCGRIKSSFTSRWNCQREIKIFPEQNFCFVKIFLSLFLCFGTVAIFYWIVWLNFLNLQRKLNLFCRSVLLRLNCQRCLE
jgi:hypothetical protein